MSEDPARIKNYELNLNEFPKHLRKIDDSTVWEEEKEDRRFISRGELSEKEIAILEELKNCIYEKMDHDQKRVADKLFNDTQKTEYTIFNDTNINSKIPLSILNAPAGTGKTMLILYYQISVNLDFGYKNGAIIYTPSYASRDAVECKIKEFLSEINNEDIVDEKTKIARECLPIYILNQFYACGPQSFNIHDDAVCASVISKFHRANISKSYDYYKLNNIQAIRECRSIIFDEAFFSTSCRSDSFIKMLVEGYIRHPYLNQEIRTKFPKLLDRIVFKKKILFAGDPYQLSVSVEQKDPGVEKYLIDEGDPIWFLQNKLRDGFLMKENITDPSQYQPLTLHKNYRFDQSVPDDLRSAIEDTRYVVYNGEPEHNTYKNKMSNLIDIMNLNKMIKYNQTHEDVAAVLAEADLQTYAVSETHRASEMINEILHKKHEKKYTSNIEIQNEFVYGVSEKLETTLEIHWVPYEEYINNKLNEKYVSKEEFIKKYELECKNGSIAHRFVGHQYPSQCKNLKTKLFLGDKVRFTIPLSTERHEIKRLLNNSIKEDLPEEFKINTGTFGRVVGFEGSSVFIEIYNQSEAEYLMKEFKLDIQTVQLPGNETSNNPIFEIKYSKDLQSQEPYFKSSFCDYILKEKKFNLAVHSYPFVNESASTIHSLQGKTIKETENVIYYMHTIRKDSLYSERINEVGQWKGSLPNIFYVALTRSRVPHKNFVLMTGAKNKTDLLNKLTSGRRPKSYTELKEFNEDFENFIQ